MSILAETAATFGGEYVRSEYHGPRNTRETAIVRVGGAEYRLTGAVYKKTLGGLTRELAARIAAK